MTKVLSNHPRKSEKTAAASSSRSNEVPRSGCPEVAVDLVSSETDSLHDSPVNYALTAIAQEVAELLKQSYPLQTDEIDSAELMAEDNSAE
ncbi:MAG: hypothetical protein WA885_14410 [Phormidesmis sp.]